MVVGGGGDGLRQAQPGSEARGHTAVTADHTTQHISQRNAQEDWCQVVARRVSMAASWSSADTHAVHHLQQTRCTTQQLCLLAWT